MSRSKKKSLHHWICGVRAGQMKEWKRQQNRILRRSKDEMPDGSHYKKENETWTSPADGKAYYKNFKDDLKPWRFLSK